MEEIRKSCPPGPRFAHFNVRPDGVKISDTKLAMIAEIYIRTTGMFCDLDQSDNCVHIDFALTVPQIKEIIRKRRKEGWKLPDV